MLHPQPLHLAAPAKINRYLEILGRRADGFHELETVFATLDWGDRLIIKPLSAAAEDCFHCDERLRPSRQPCLAGLQAWRRAGGTPPAAAISLEKSYPPAAAWPVAQVTPPPYCAACNNSPAALSSEQLAAVAAELGSDVPFFPVAGQAHAVGRGEALTPG